MKEIEKELIEINKKLFGNNFEKRPFIRLVLSKIDELYFSVKDKNKRKNIFIIEAPTGYGKTTISLVLSNLFFKRDEVFKTIIAYPLRTLLEDQNKTFSKIFDNDFLGCRYMHNPTSPYLVRPVTLTTIDTLSMTLFGIPPEDFEKLKNDYGLLGHFFFSWSNVVLSNVILDEVHLVSDQTKSLSFLLFLIKYAVEMNFLLVLMSATIPKNLIAVIENSLTKTEKEKMVTIFFSKRCASFDHSTYFYESNDDNFVKDRKQKNYSIDLIGINEEYLEKEIEHLLTVNSEFNKVLLIFNTVSDAIKFYNYIKNKIKDRKIILLHSRFTESDRNRKIKELEEVKSKDKYIVIATQVIEAGVDISSNLMITELSPANSLIQRTGRFLRKSNEKKGKIIIWYKREQDKDYPKIDINISNKNNSQYYYLILDNGIYNKIKDKIKKKIIKKLKNSDKKEININLYDKKDKYNTVQVYYSVYDYTLTYRTFEFLKNNAELNFHLPFNTNGKKGYNELLDYVYKRDSFEYEQEIIMRFNYVFLDFARASRRAFETFIELEGSFVRNSLLIPIEIENCNGIIPLDYKTLVTLIKKGLINEIFTKKSNDEMENITGIINKKSKYLKELIKYFVYNNITCLVIRSNDIKYDQETGLSW